MKTTQMQIRIEQELKDEFHNICQHNSINSSSLIRQWIEKFVNDNKEVNKK